MYKYTACGKFIVKKELFTNTSSFSTNMGTSNSFNVGASTLASASATTTIPNTTDLIRIPSLSSVAVMDIPTTPFSSMPTAGVMNKPSIAIMNMPTTPVSSMPIAGVMNMPTTPVSSMPIAGVMNMPTLGVMNMPSVAVMDIHTTPVSSMPIAGVMNMPHVNSNNTAAYNNSLSTSNFYRHFQ